MITAERYHDISCGHRVHGHESKCAHLHGHNYRIHFVCEMQARPGLSAQVDPLGRVIDFSVIKSRLCMWVENYWDHRFLAWEKDPILIELSRDLKFESCDALAEIKASVVWVPFNPTAENMADYLLRRVGPSMLAGTGVELIEVRVEETRKCSATARLQR